ncbi:MAG: hypothetical protein IIW49_06785 [Treponema sp.]|nr:hypothetical protein [Treponema sp.]
MKHTFKTLLGLVLVVLFLAGCSNPAGPEIPEVNEPPVVEVPEVNEPPVVETPEDTSNLTKVEFKWGTNTDVGSTRGTFEAYSPLYILDLHFDTELNDYVYGFPEGYDLESYVELLNDKERFKEFSDDVFEKFFGTKYYKEGTTIDLEGWTKIATDSMDAVFESCLKFSTKDNKEIGWTVEDPIDEIIVGNEDIIIYVFWYCDLKQSKLL